MTASDRGGREEALWVEHVEAAAEAMATSEVIWGTHSDRWGDTQWQMEFWRAAAERGLGYTMDALLDAADRADAAEARVAELEATVARVKALADDWAAYAEEGMSFVWAAREHDLRAALAPAQGETGVEG